MTFKIPPPRRPARNLWGTQASPVRKRARGWAAAPHKLSPVAVRRNKARNALGATAARGRPSARAPPPQPGRLPRPHRLSCQAGPPLQSSPRPLKPALQVPTAQAQFHRPPLPARCFIHLPAQGGGRARPSPSPSQRCAGLKAGTPGQVLTLGVR